MTEPNAAPGCLGALLRLLGLGPKPPAALPYRAARSLLTPAEVSFYHVLTGALGTRGVVCCKVRLADVLFTPASNGRNRRFFLMISQKHMDFVVCDPRSLRPLLAVELDDVSHRRPSRQARDAFVGRAFAAARLPL